MDEMEQQIMFEMSENLQEQKQSTEAIKFQIEKLLQSQAKMIESLKNMEKMMPMLFSQIPIPSRPPSQPPDPPDFKKSDLKYDCTFLHEVESIETGSLIQQIEPIDVKDVISTNLILSNGSNPEEESRPEEASTHKADLDFGEETMISNVVPSQVSLYHLPVFDGTLPDCWIMEVDRFFELEQYENEEKLNLISLSVEGAALKWFRKHRREFTDWTYMKRKLMVRFGLVKGCSPPEVLPKEKFITKVDQDTYFGSEKESTNSVEITSIKGHEVQGTTASHVRQFDVTTIADAVGISKCCESSLLQHSSATQSRAPFSPYQSYNDQPYYERKFGECPEIEFDRESDEIKDVKLQDKQPEEDVKTLVISENEQSLECVGDEPFDDEKPGEVTVEDIIDKSVDKIREKKLTIENESSPEVSLQILLSQFQVSLSSLEPGRRYHKESLVVVNDLSSDLGCVIGKIIGCICDSEIGQDNSLDEEEFNRVWEPGGVVLIEHDKWKGSEKCYELSRVVRLMQGLPSRRWSYGKVAELTQEVQQPKTCLKEIKLKELDRLVTCSSVGYIVALLMVYDAERLIQSDVPPIFSDLLCVKNRIQGRLKMVLLLEFLWLILFTFKMFKSSNVPQNKNQTGQKLSSYWKLLLSWKIISNIHVSSRCVLRQEESYVKVLELIKDRDSRKRKLCKNWWFKYKLYTWLSEALHLWRKRKYEKLQILGRATHGLLLKQNFSQVLLHIQNRDYSFFGYMLVATSLVETENIYSFSVKGTHMEGEIMGFKLLLTSGLNWKTFIEWVKIYFSEKQYQENTRLMRSATTKLIRSDFCHLFVRKIHVIGALHNFEKTVAATKVNQNSETSQDCYLLLFLERVKASFEIKFTMEQSEKPLITILSYEWFHSPRPPELACCKEDEESTAKFSYLRTSMFSSREYCDRVYLNHTTLTHFYL